MTTVTSAGPGVETTTLSRDRSQLERTWANATGVLGWFMQVNHRIVGKRFIITAFVFFALGGVQAFLMRLQLAQPENVVLDAELYNQIFTMHGTTMMFFFAVPVLEGFLIYVVPLMLGVRDMAFPRLNAFGYWVYLIAGISLYVGLFFNRAPDAGWFMYPPLTSPEFSPGIRSDLWATMITFIEISALVAAVEIIVTIFKQKPPGMSINRMPLLAWAALVVSFMIIFAMPTVMIASVMLALDRLAGTLFFDPAGGGSPLLWQHLFWFFGHPEVYIILVPALGFVASMVTVAARRPMFGYGAIALALTAIGIASFGLWVHHMFTTGLPPLGVAFFTTASVMIAIPSGVQIFCWMATLWGARPRITTSLLFVGGFVVTFVAGGITGVMVASVPFDQQVHDSFFVVAHFHYVLIGGMVFPLLGALFHWFPKLTGRLMSERLGKVSFWLVLLGFHITFFPMHQLGFEGMPRRVYTYLEEMGWGTLNLVSTGGAVVLAAGLALIGWNVVASLRRGQRAGSNPWGADSLEWATGSPPPTYNFDGIPVVRGRYPMWEREVDGDSPVAVGLSDHRREVLVTSVIGAEPHNVAIVPGPSIWPLLLALSVSVAFLGALVSLWFVPLGAFLAFLCLAGWHWPRGEERTPPWKEARRQRRQPAAGQTAAGAMAPGTAARRAEGAP